MEMVAGDIDVSKRRGEIKTDKGPGRVSQVKDGLLFCRCRKSGYGFSCFGIALTVISGNVPSARIA